MPSAARLVEEGLAPTRCRLFSLGPRPPRPRVRPSPPGGAGPRPGAPSSASRGAPAGRPTVRLGPGQASGDAAADQGGAAIGATRQVAVCRSGFHHPSNPPRPAPGTGRRCRVGGAGYDESPQAWHRHVPAPSRRSSDHEGEVGRGPFRPRAFVADDLDPAQRRGTDCRPAREKRAGRACAGRRRARRPRQRRRRRSPARRRATWMARPAGAGEVEGDRLPVGTPARLPTTNRGPRSSSSTDEVDGRRRRPSWPGTPTASRMSCSCIQQSITRIRMNRPVGVGPGWR